MNFVLTKEKEIKIEMNKIKLIEIELFSYCNRKCSWCPNYLINRSNNIFIKEKIFDKLLNNLLEFNYQGIFSFSRYMNHLLFLFFLKKKYKK